MCTKVAGGREEREKEADTETERGNWVLKNMRQHFRRHMSPVKLCKCVWRMSEKKTERESKKQKVLVVYCVCMCVCMRVCVRMNVFGICPMRQADKILFAA